MRSNFNRPSLAICVGKKLFIDGNLNLFSESKTLKFLNKFNHPKLSAVMLLLAIVCSWYEGLCTGLGLSWFNGTNLGIVFLVFALLLCDKSKLKSSKSIIYLLLFTITMSLSTLIAALCGMQFVILGRGVVLFLQFILAFIIGSTYNANHKIIGASLFLLLPIMLVGLYQGIFGPETSKLWVSTAENLVDKRAYGFFGSPNILGSLTMMSAIVSLFWGIQHKKKYFLSITLLSLIVMMLTYSRSAWIGLTVGLAVAVIISKWRYILFFPLGLLVFFIPSVRQRFLTLFNPGYTYDASLDGRIWSFNNAISIFKTSPIFGTGPGSYGGETAVQYASPVYLKGFQGGYVALSYTDNQWLQILVQTGVVGFISLMSFFVSNLVNNIKKYHNNRNNIYLTIVALTIAIFINGCFANIMEFSAVAIWAGLLLSMGENYEQ